MDATAAPTPDAANAPATRPSKKRRDRNRARMRSPFLACRPPADTVLKEPPGRFKIGESMQEAGVAQPPYRSYAAIMGTFAGGLAAAGALRRLVDRAPQRPTTRRIAVLPRCRFTRA